jgi:Ca2+/Na+ antiporter
MRGWLRRALYAAQLAGDRADLWPAGALAWLAFAGWIPFLVVVARPDPNDLAFIGVSIYTSGAFPLNVIGLAVFVLAAFALLCLASATAQVALLRSAAAPDAERPPFSRAMLTGFAIVLLAAVPAIGALVALLAGVAAVAPDAFTSPDTSTPILVRLGAPLLPFLIAFVVALLAGQAFGGTALRLAHQAPGASITTVLGRAGRALLRRPSAAVGVVLGGLLLDVLVLVVTSALLSVLWMPIGSALDGGRLATPETLLLLLGFVAIWLGLLLAAGAVQVAVSAWWAIEQARHGRAIAREELPPVEGAPPIGTGTGGTP